MSWLEQLVERAKQPGVMGLVGMRQESRCKKDLQAYFKLLQRAIERVHVDDVVKMNDFMARDAIAMRVRQVVRRLQPQLLAVLKLNIEEAFVKGWQTTQIEEAEKKQDPFPIDILGESGKAAAAYAEKRSAELVTGINQQTVELIQNAVSQGIEQQLGVGGTGRLIRRSVANMSRKRAEVIASTEMNDAMSEATMQKLDTLGIAYKRWIAEPDACPECEPNDDLVIPITEFFPSGDLRPPAHPNCRCAVVGARAPEA